MHLEASNPIRLLYIGHLARPDEARIVKGELSFTILDSTTKKQPYWPIRV
jgi:hypothetical protein